MHVQVFRAVVLDDVAEARMGVVELDHSAHAGAKRAARRPSPSRESSLSRTMQSADEAMVEDGRGCLQAYRPAERVTRVRGRALAGERGDLAKQEFTSSRASRGQKISRTHEEVQQKTTYRRRPPPFVGWPAPGRPQLDLSTFS